MLQMFSIYMKDSLKALLVQPCQSTRRIREKDIRSRLWSRQNSVPLVVLKASHPLRPVRRLDEAGFGPRPCRVELAMPFQCPQLF